MALRDLPHRGHRNIFVLGDLSLAALDAMTSALSMLVSEPTFRSTRRRGPNTGMRRFLAPSAARLAAKASVVTIGEADTTALIQIALQLDFTGLPIFIVLSGRRAAICVDHEVFDGTASMAVVEFLLARAAGGDIPIVRRPLARLPLLLALTSIPPRQLVRIALKRTRERRGPTVTAPASDGSEPGTGRPPALAEVRIDEMLLGSLRRIPSGGGNRATLNSRLCSVIITVLQDVAVSRRDLPVRVPVDLRSAVRGRRVDGNFVYVPQIGTLFGSTWMPAEITERLATSSVMDGVVSLAGSSAIVLARSVLRRPAHHAVGITVSFVRARHELPVSAFGHRGRIELACTSSRNGFPATFVFVWLLKSTAHISVWDDTGLFDLRRFESVFQAEVERRASTA